MPIGAEDEFVQPAEQRLRLCIRRLIRRRELRCGRFRCRSQSGNHFALNLRRAGIRRRDLLTQREPLRCSELSRACQRPSVRHDFHQPATNDIKAVGWIKLLKDQTASRDFEQINVVSQQIKFLIG